MRKCTNQNYPPVVIWVTLLYLFWLVRCNFDSAIDERLIRDYTAWFDSAGAGQNDLWLGMVDARR
jgi:hypothetical protein